MRWSDDSRGIYLYCGDCLQVMPKMIHMPSEAVVTDPPFAFAGGLSNGLASRADSQFFEHWLASVFAEIHKASMPTAPWFLWCDWRTASIYDEVLGKSAEDYYDTRRVSQVLVHDREMVGMGSPFRNQTDWIAVVRGKKTKFPHIPNDQPNIIRSYWYYGKHDHHPAEKCIDFASRLVTWAASSGETILDPFMGSGTVGIAAIRQGRKFIGIEQEPKYFEVAKSRILEELNRAPLFAEDVA